MAPIRTRNPELNASRGLSPETQVQLPALQPFQCPTCKRRFTRHENLKRHVALHCSSGNSGSKNYTCAYCSTTFSRRDLKSRHIKKKHPEFEHELTTTTNSKDVGDDQILTEFTIPDHVERTGRSDSTTSLDVDGHVNVDVNENDVDYLLHSSLEDSNGTFNGISQFNDASNQDPSTGMFDFTHDADHSIGVEHRRQPTNQMKASGPLDVSSLIHSPTGDHQKSDPTPFQAYQFETFHPIDLPHSSGNAVASTSIRDSDSANTATNTNTVFSDKSAGTSHQHRRAALSAFATHLSTAYPFFHRPTFDMTSRSNPSEMLETEDDPLILAMVCIGILHVDCGTDEERQHVASACFNRARRLLRERVPSPRGGTSPGVNTSSTESLRVMQTYILLEVYAIMYSCGEDTYYGLQLHSKLVAPARQGGLMEPLPPRSIQTSGSLDELWKEFVKSESHKRTLFTVYQLDATWYHLLSIPRLLSHLEIKHEMPCDEGLWSASTASEWAHRSLINVNTNLTGGVNKTPMKYISAVRLCLSSAKTNPARSPPTPLSPETSTTPSTFASWSPFGVTNVIWFILSSIREVSGWSTMTGRICFERFEALQAAINALEATVIQHSKNDNQLNYISDSVSAPAMSMLTEATWRMAMVELLMWNLSHTNGVVEGSMDAALAAATHLSSTNHPPTLDPAFISSLDSHISWFINYLQNTSEEASQYEPPWLTVYAYKVILIAFQFAKNNVYDSAFGPIGVSDIEGFIAWTWTVFERRKKSKIGQIILNCLEELEV